MSKNNNGGAAFPVSNTEYPNGQIQFGTDGMTLRDYFAAKAMQGILSDPTIDHTAYTLSELAYKASDAMLKVREL